MTKTDAVSAVVMERTGLNPQPLRADLEILNSGLCSVFLGTFRMMAALDEKYAEEILNNLVWARKELKDESAKANVDRAEPTIAKEKAVASRTSKPITKDDLTKIIVQKIKKDRSNNEKIGQILKDYGVCKISEMPEERYEAFLTDLSAI